MSDQATYRLSRNAFGRLVFTEANGAVREGVIPVRAFPITAPDHSIALVDQHGHELAWIEQLSGLPDELRAIVAAELATREFIPEIRRIRDVSSFVTPARGRWKLTAAIRLSSSRAKKISGALLRHLCSLPTVRAYSS